MNSSPFWDGMNLYSSTVRNKNILHHEKSTKYRIELALLEGTFVDQVQLTDHFSTNQKLRNIIHYNQLDIVIL